MERLLSSFSTAGRFRCVSFKGPLPFAELLLLGSRSRRRRRGASTTSHSDMRGLQVGTMKRLVQSRMTVLRREVTRS
jgi:hypothetical protein